MAVARTDLSTSSSSPSPGLPELLHSYLHEDASCFWILFEKIGLDNKLTLELRFPSPINEIFIKQNKLNWPCPM